MFLSFFKSICDASSPSLTILLCVLPILFSWKISCVTAQGTPTISYISLNQTKDIGGTVNLQCAVDNAKDYSVIWKKIETDPEDPKYLSTGSLLIVKDSRFSIKYNPNPPSYTLQIKDIQETDAGSYQCQILITVVRSVTADTILFVRRPPVISDNSTQYLLESEGSSVQMECYADGYPTPTITWGRENNPILPKGNVTYDGNILTIYSVKKEDRDTYYCIANNGVSKSDRRNIYLKIEFAPVISVPMSRYGLGLQSIINIECHVEAYPPPVIVWLKDNVQLSNNQHYKISEIDTDNGVKNSTLSIITVKNKHYGDYICKAENNLGIAEAKINLFETLMTVCPPACGTHVNQIMHNDNQSQVEKTGFQVSIDVQQFRPNELSVKAVDNTVIVEGKHKQNQNEHGLIEFRHKYKLPNGYDVKEVFSTLSTDGVLTIKGPPPQQLNAGNERIIKIQQTGLAHLDMKNQSSSSGAAAGDANTNSFIRL